MLSFQARELLAEFLQVRTARASWWVIGDRPQSKYVVSHIPELIATPYARRERVFGLGAAFQDAAPWLKLLELAPGPTALDQ